MHECLSCRSYRQVQRFHSKRQPFARLEGFPQYAPDRPFRMRSIALDLEVDPRAKQLQGSVTHTVEKIADEAHIVLDQVGLTIDSVVVEGVAAEYWTDDTSLTIEIPGKHAKKALGDKLTFTVKYRVKEPKRGLYFTGPHPQVWSQGQDEDNRYWFPTFDYPNQKATVELKVTVPKGFWAISNGILAHQATLGQKAQFTYQMRAPIVTYLVTLVVGEFERWEDRGPRDLLVEYFVAPGRKEEGMRSFRHTPDMIRAFESCIGVPYPYDKYAQVAVQDFIFGGMENASATTQTDWTLHDARAALDVSSDGLVAHELAHQWFGDLLTCRDWSHGWLNEGFATFFERVWAEHKKGEGGGADEAAYISLQDWKDYLAEDSAQYRRPIVCSRYDAPQDLFDRHLYQKGGLVLNLLRSILGEKPFWASIQHYVASHKDQNVETLDLIRSIEHCTGKNMRKFFDQWVFGAGHPDWKMSAEFKVEQSAKWIHIEFEQKQTGGKPVMSEEHGAKTWVFHLPIEFEVTHTDGSKSLHTFEVNGLKHQFRIDVTKPVAALRFDPSHAIPKHIEFKRPRAWLLHQLSHAKDAMGRIEAARALAGPGASQDAEVIQALCTQGLKDPFWGVGVEIAEALGDLHSTPAQDALLKMVATPHAKARVAVMEALGQYRDVKVFEALIKKADKDESYAVEAAATRNAAKTLPADADRSLTQQWENMIARNLKKSSYLEQIKRAALSAWVSPPSGIDADRDGVLRPIEAALQENQSVHVRMGAVVALGRLAKVAKPALRSAIMAHFKGLLKDTNFFIRRVWVSAIAESGCREGLALLDQAMALESDARVLRGAKFARDRLVAGFDRPEAIESIRTQVERLEKALEKKAQIKQTSERKAPGKKSKRKKR